MAMIERKGQPNPRVKTDVSRRCASVNAAYPFSLGLLLLMKIIFASLIFILSACSSKVSTDLKEGADAFYKVYLEVRPSGLPEKKEQELLKPWISSGLSKLILDADVADDGNKEEGPPLLQGDIFSSLFEGPTEFEVGACSESGERRSCQVKLTYVDRQDKSKTQWNDNIYLLQESGKWVVDDIEYRGDWPFASRGTLRATLQGAINHYRR